MRRLAWIASAAFALVACSGDPTSPGNNDDLTVLQAGAFGTTLTATGGYDADVYQDRLINGLPDNLRLTDDQKARIKSLVEAFQQATKADREALGAILRQARQAIEGKKSRSEVQAILATGAPIKDRLVATEAKLKSDIDAVLTAEQRAWIQAHLPRLCRADQFPPLTDAQKAQIHALEVAFQTANKADLDAVKAILDEAAQALKAGASESELGAILFKAAAPLQRLTAARFELRLRIMAVLTPEQRASGCLPLG